ncbi:MAG: DUF4097 domain-containing protein [Lachnospiraceae bacterium]|nr:DUF4097 domain-containing protein [Lachnospiraceae bacterium]
MKNFTKICLIICGILIGVGLLCFVTAACLGFSRGQLWGMVEDGRLSVGSWDIGRFIGWDWDDWYDDWNWEADEDMDWGMKNWTIDSDKLEAGWKEDAYTFDPAEIRELDIEYKFGTVQIEKSESGKIEIESNYRNIWGNYDRDVKCSQEGPVLKIRDRVDKKILRMKHGISDAALIIRLPEDYRFTEMEMGFGGADVTLDTLLLADQVQLVIGAGRLEGNGAKRLIDAKEIELGVGAGEMEVSGLRTEKLTGECGVGNLRIGDVTAEDCSLECGIGHLSLTVNGKEEDYDYEIQCGIGNVQLGGSTYGGLGASKRIDHHADRKMDIDCGIGEVVVSFQQE